MLMVKPGGTPQSIEIACLILSTVSASPLNRISPMTRSDVPSLMYKEENFWLPCPCMLGAVLAPWLIEAALCGMPLGIGVLLLLLLLLMFSDIGLALPLP